MPRIRHSVRARRKRLVASAVMLAALCVGLVAAWKLGDYGVRTTAVPAAERAGLASLDRGAALGNSPLPAPSTQTSRPVFPYSIVSGGVHSVEELRLAMRYDPVVAAHYADFDLSRARVETVSVSRAVHVSYRKGASVYWTTRRVNLKQGETILTDGVNEARTRCGNRIAEVAPAEIEREEPAPEVLETPLSSRTVPFDPLAGYDLFAASGDLPLSVTEEEVLPSTPLPDPVMPTISDPPSIVPPLLPPFFPDVPWEERGTSSVPEPATLLLVSPGILYLFRRARKAR
jgi:hypothetical protein